MNKLLYINAPNEVTKQNLTLHFSIERIPIKNTDLINSIGEKTSFSVIVNGKIKSKLFLPDTRTKVETTYPNPESKSFVFELNREIAEDISNLPLKLMPGFKHSWRYEPEIMNFKLNQVTERERNFVK